MTRRLRVFAGPNGSGKSTMIHALREVRVDNRPIDFGLYVNADDIAAALRENSFGFHAYELSLSTRAEFCRLSLATGLVGARFAAAAFESSFEIGYAGNFRLTNDICAEHLAQVLATVIRERLLNEGRKISIETVFSHPSKLEFMRRARAQGYKIYLYFVATESPDINISRIKEVRVLQGGHDVPENTVRERYGRSLDLLYDASELAYQGYFFDNSKSAIVRRIEPFAHFKLVQGRKVWDRIELEQVPEWFDSWYLQKVPAA